MLIRAGDDGKGMGRAGIARGAKSDSLANDQVGFKFQHG
jgi:hypothetical protein